MGLTFYVCPKNARFMVSFPFRFYDLFMFTILQSSYCVAIILKEDGRGGEKLTINKTLNREDNQGFLLLPLPLNQERQWCFQLFALSDLLLLSLTWVIVRQLMSLRLKGAPLFVSQAHREERNWSQTPNDGFRFLHKHPRWMQVSDMYRSSFFFTSFFLL